MWSAVSDELCGWKFKPNWPQFPDWQLLSTHKNKPDVISKCFRIFQKKLDTTNHVVLLWIFQCCQLSLVYLFAQSNSPFIQNYRRCNLHLNSPIWSYSVRTDWHISSNSDPVSTMFAAVAVVMPIAATAYWHWYCFVFTQFYVTSWTVNMHRHTAASHSVFCLIMTGALCTEIEELVLQHTIYQFYFAGYGFSNTVSSIRQCKFHHRCCHILIYCVVKLIIICVGDEKKNESRYYYRKFSVTGNQIKVQFSPTH